MCEIGRRKQCTKHIVKRELITKQNETGDDTDLKYIQIKPQSEGVQITRFKNARLKVVRYTMSTVKWAHSTDMEPDDVIISDNLLVNLVKDEDIVTALDTHDDILQQGNS